jgi:hypothetical protein
VNLVPLRYGAGIKGKIADCWYVGVPCVTTPIGTLSLRTINITSYNYQSLAIIAKQIPFLEW